MNLNRTENPIDRIGRQRINENWHIIEDNYNNVVNKISEEAYEQIVNAAKLIWQSPVDDFASLSTAYPNPEEGWAAMTRDTGIVYRYYENDGWKPVQQITVGPLNEVDERLSNQLSNIAVDVTLFGAVPTTNRNNLINATAGFQSAANFAKTINSRILIPDGEFYIAGTVTLECEVECKGKILLSPTDSGSAFSLYQEETVYNNPQSYLTAINEGKTTAGWIDNLPEEVEDGDMLYIETSEVLINRNNASNPFYTKNDSFMLVDKSNFTILPPYAHTINDLSKVTKLKVRKKLQTSLIDGLNFEFLDIATQENNRSAITSNRDNILFNNLQVRNDTSLQVKIAVSLNGSSQKFVNAKINGCKDSTLGYAISTGNVSFVEIDSSELLESNHGVSGRHTKDISVKNSRIYDFDNHYGYNAVITDSWLETNIKYSGYKITIERCTFSQKAPQLLTVRGDTPELYGDVIIKDCQVQSSDVLNYNEVVYINCDSSFNFGRKMRTANYYIDNLTIECPATNTHIVYLVNTGSLGYSPSSGREAIKLSYNNVKTNASAIQVLPPRTYALADIGDVLKMNDIKGNITVSLNHHSTTTLDLGRGHMLDINNCGVINFLVDPRCIAKNSVVKNTTISGVRRIGFAVAASGEINKLTLQSCLLNNAMVNVLFKILFIDNTVTGIIDSEWNTTEPYGYAGLQSRITLSQNNKVSPTSTPELYANALRQQYSDSTVFTQPAYFSLINNYKEGNGSPEGVVTSPRTSLYSDLTNGKLYFKAIGTGNTGWKEVTVAT